MNKTKLKTERDVRLAQLTRHFHHASQGIKTGVLAAGAGVGLVISGTAILPAVAVAVATVACASALQSAWNEYKRGTSVVSEEQLDDDWVLMTAHVSEDNAQERWNYIMQDSPVGNPFARRVAQAGVDHNNAEHRKESFTLFQDAIDAVKRHIDQSGGRVEPLHVAKMIELRDIVEHRRYIERGGGYPWRAQFKEAVMYEKIFSGRKLNKILEDDAPNEYFFDTIDSFLTEHYATVATKSLDDAMVLPISDKPADLLAVVKKVQWAAIIDKHIDTYLPGERSGEPADFAAKSSLVEQLERMREAGTKSMDSMHPAEEASRGKLAVAFFEATQKAAKQIEDYDRYLPNQLTTDSVEIAWVEFGKKNKEELTHLAAIESVYAFDKKLDDYVYKHGMTSTAIKYSGAFHTAIETILNSELYRNEPPEKPGAFSLPSSGIRHRRDLLVERIQEHAPKLAMVEIEKLQAVKIDAGDCMNFMEIAERVVDAGIAQKAATPFMTDGIVAKNVQIIQNHVETLRAAISLGLDDATWNPEERMLPATGIAKESRRVLDLAEKSLNTCIETRDIKLSAKAEQLKETSFEMQ